MTFAEKLRIIKSGQITRQLVCWGIFTEHQIRERSRCRHAEKGAGTCSGNNQSDLQRRIIRRGEHEYEQS